MVWQPDIPEVLTVFQLNLFWPGYVRELLLNDRDNSIYPIDIPPPLRFAEWAEIQPFKQIVKLHFACLPRMHLRLIPGYGLTVEPPPLWLSDP